MTTPTVAMTKLDAVNQMLASIGESPLNSITGTIPKDANKAVIALDTTLREVLNNGWSFNSDTDYELTPESGSGYILIPSGALWVDPQVQSNDYVMRYNPTEDDITLYDRDDHTFVFSDSVKCNVIWGRTDVDRDDAERAKD